MKILKNSAFSNLHFATIALLSFIVLLSACEKDYPNNQTPLERVENYQSKELNADLIFNQIKEQANNELITIDLSEVEENWVFTMKQEQVYADDSKTIEVRENVEHEVELEKAYFLSGNDKAKRPALIISRKNKFYLEFVDNERLTIVEALTKHKPDANKSQYIMYTSEDMIIDAKHSYGCSATDFSVNNEKQISTARNAKMIDADRFVEITCEADKLFRSFVGSSLDTFQEMADIVFLGGARFWFYSDYNLKPLLKRRYIFYNNIIPTPSTPEEALNAWAAASPIGDVDAKVIFTGRWDIREPGRTGFAMGAANRGVACSKSYQSYAFNAFWPHDFVRHQLFAHELAHLFNGQHQPGDGPLTENVFDAKSVNFSWQAENQMNIYLEEDANESCLFD